MFLLFQPFFTSILTAAVLVVLFHGFYDFLLLKTGERPALSAFLTCLFVTFVVVVPVVSVGGLVVKEFVDIVQKYSSNVSFLPSAIDNVFSFLPSDFSFDKQSFSNIVSSGDFSSQMRGLSQSLVSVAEKTYSGVAGGVLWVIVLFFTLFYLLVDGRRLLSWVKYMSPLRDEYEELLIRRFVSMSRATIKGTLVIGLIQGLIGGVAFFAVGVPSVLVWTVLMIFLSAIPLLGAGLVWMPAALIFLFTGNVWQGVVLLIVGFGVISTIDNILRPRLVGGDTQIHPLLVFFSTLGGISVFGLSGFIIGPILVALFLSLWGIYAKEFREDIEGFNSGRRIC